MRQKGHGHTEESRRFASIQVGHVVGAFGIGHLSIVPCVSDSSGKIASLPHTFLEDLSCLIQLF